MAVKNPLVAFFVRYAQRLRFPTLFLVTITLFLVDLIVPDVIPFADEILLGLASAGLATLKKRHEAGEREPDGVSEPTSPRAGSPPRTPSRSGDR